MSNNHTSTNLSHWAKSPGESCLTKVFDGRDHLFQPKFHHQFGKSETAHNSLDNSHPFKYNGNRYGEDDNTHRKIIDNVKNRKCFSEEIVLLQKA